MIPMTMHYSDHSESLRFLIVVRTHPQYHAGGRRDIIIHGRCINELYNPITWKISKKPQKKLSHNKKNQSSDSLQQRHFSNLP